MARKTFFSFHYERDAWRASQVRNSNLLPRQDQSGFIDCAEWQSIERQGDKAIERWICDQMEGSSASTVLIGTETASRPWVRYEILESWNRGNGVLGVRIHGIKNQDRATDLAGANPFDLFQFQDGTPLSSICKVYDWVLDDGRTNLGRWIEEAIETRSKYRNDEKIIETKIIPKPTASGYGMSASAPFVPKAPWCPNDVV